MRWGSISSTVPAKRGQWPQAEAGDIQINVRKKNSLWSRGEGAELMVGLVDLKGLFQPR